MGKIYLRLVGEVLLTPPHTSKIFKPFGTVESPIDQAESEKTRFLVLEFWKWRNKIGKKRRTNETCTRFKCTDYQAAY